MQAQTSRVALDQFPNQIFRLLQFPFLKRRPRAQKHHIISHSVGLPLQTFRNHIIPPFLQLGFIEHQTRTFRQFNVCAVTQILQFPTRQRLPSLRSENKRQAKPCTLRKPTRILMSSQHDLSFIQVLLHQQRLPSPKQSPVGFCLALQQLQNPIGSPIPRPSFCGKRRQDLLLLRTPLHVFSAQQAFSAQRCNPRQSFRHCALCPAKLTITFQITRPSHGQSTPNRNPYPVKGNVSIAGPTGIHRPK